MKIGRGFCLKACFMIAASVAVAQTLEDEFQQANEHYRAGRFREAADRYESILRQGIVSSPLFFNLGNAYYRLGNIPQAILAYERAMRLEPGDPDVVFNLRLARMRTIDRIEPVPELFLISWIRAAGGAVSLGTAAATFVAAWIMLFGSLAFLQVVASNPWTVFLRWIVLGSLTLTIVSGGVLGLHASQIGDRSEAIVTSDVVTAKTSPDAQSVDAFVIHGGLKVRLEDTVGEWTKIILADGKVGWIRFSTVERI